MVDDPARFAQGSVAARGLFALDYLLFDPAAGAVTGGSYRCRLLGAITTDLAATADGVLARWRDPYARIITTAGAPDNPLYFAPEESSRELFTALTAGLQTVHDLRLGRPMGTFDAPQPRRAEAWRSGRSLRNVELSLEALRAFATVAFLPELPEADAAPVLRAFDAAIAAAGRVGAPIDAAVANPQGRLRVEVVQTEVAHVNREIGSHVGPTVGVTSGFNAMDGD